jgi:hypothetical protein
VKYSLSAKENDISLIKDVGEKVLMEHQHPEIGKQQEDGDI